MIQTLNGNNNEKIQSTDIWDKFQKRDSDIFITSTIKSGTTWIQQIVSQIVFKGEFNQYLESTSVWIDSHLDRSFKETLQILSAQTHRRFIKSHSNAEFVMKHKNPLNKYIFITRDYRDVVWSFFNHIKLSKKSTSYNLRRGILMSRLKKCKNEKQMWDIIFQNDDLFHNKNYNNIFSYFATIKSWLIHKNDPNVLILHFNDLKQNLKSCITQIIQFLGYTTLHKSSIDTILMKSSFAWMRKHSHKCAPTNFEKKLSLKKTNKIKKIKSCSGNFINKGTNKRWRGELSNDDLEPYHNIMRGFFNDKEIQWIENGGELPL